MEFIKGHFTKQEAIEIITHVIHVKIKFHENKIHSTSNEEDIKMREKRILQLQKDLYEARLKIEQHHHNNISLNGALTIN
jgi:hypothetical protein